MLYVDFPALLTPCTNSRTFPILENRLRNQILVNTYIYKPHACQPVVKVHEKKKSLSATHMLYSVTILFAGVKFVAAIGTQGTTARTTDIHRRFQVLWPQLLPSYVHLEQISDIRVCKCIV